MAFVRESVIINGKPLDLRDRPARQAGRTAPSSSPTARASSSSPPSAATSAPGSTSSPSPASTSRRRSPPGRSPEASSSAKARQRDEEILTCASWTARSARSSPRDIKNDTQVIATVLSSDKENPTDVLALTGASAALHISDIPWGGPLAGVRVARVDGEFVAVPHVRAAGSLRHRPRRRVLEGRHRDGRGRRGGGHRGRHHRRADVRPQDGAAHPRAHRAACAPRWASRSATFKEAPSSTRRRRRASQASSTTDLKTASLIKDKKARYDGYKAIKNEARPRRCSSELGAEKFAEHREARQGRVRGAQVRRRPRATCSTRGSASTGAT